MPKVSEEHRAARRAQIIEAALQVFARNGYSRASMADIIAESGLSAGAIYGYFEGKQELLHAVAAHVLDARRADVAALSADHLPSPSEVLTTVLSGLPYRQFAPVVIQLWGEATIDPKLRPVFRGVFAQLRATMADTLTAWGEAHPDRVPASDPDWAEAAASVMTSMGPGFLLFGTLVDEFDPDAYLAAVSSVFRLERPGD